MENMMKTYYKRRLHDRDDGWRVRDIDNVYTIVPYVLRTRIDSQCFFEEEIDVDRVEAFIRAHKQDIPNLTIMHIVIAAMVRIMSQRPYINRYIVYNKLYAHNCIQISLCIKRSLTDRGVETVIKPVFEPTDTLAMLLDESTQPACWLRLGCNGTRGARQHGTRGSSRRCRTGSSSCCGKPTGNTARSRTNRHRVSPG